MQVLLEAQNGKKPRRPTNPAITDTIWSRINDCWVDEPEKRPTMDQVCRNLGRMFHNASSWQALTRRRDEAGSSVVNQEGPSRGELLLENNDIEVEAIAACE